MFIIDIQLNKLNCNKIGKAPLGMSIKGNVEVVGIKSIEGVSLV